MHKRIRIACCIVLVMLCQANVFAQAEPPPALQDLAVFEDKAGTETIDSIVRIAADEPRRFTALPAGSLARGYTRSTFWLRFTLAAPAGTWLLDLLPPYVDDLRLYVPDPDHAGAYAEQRAGDRHPLANAGAPYRSFVFEIHQPDGAAQTLYVRLQTSSASVLVPRLWSGESFHAAMQLEYGLLFAGIAILATLLVINVVWWFWLRDPLTSWFVAYLAALILLLLGNDGFVLQFLFPATPGVADHWVSVSALLAIAIGMGFFRRAFQVGPDERMLFLLFRAAFWLPLLAILCVFIDRFTEVMPWVMRMLVAMNLIALWLSFRLWRRQSVGASAILAANVISLLGILSLSLSLLGLMQSDFLLLNGMQISSLGIGLSFHFALVARHRMLQEEHVQVEYRAYHDPLTGLPNRLLFHDKITHSLALARRNSSRCALLFIDLDRFKPINDKHGHEAGDRVLLEVARRLLECVRDSDIVGRFGGDEFVVLLTGIDRIEVAHMVAGKIRDVLNRPFAINAEPLHISSSIGIALFPDHGENEIELTHHADLAMYRAKQGGPNRIASYTGDMSTPPTGTMNAAQSA
jgi:diguanylate cyclase (GGDEF)-like protein